MAGLKRPSDSSSRRLLTSISSARSGVVRGRPPRASSAFRAVSAPGSHGCNSRCMRWSSGPSNRKALAAWASVTPRTFTSTRVQKTKKVASWSPSGGMQPASAKTSRASATAGPPRQRFTRLRAPGQRDEHPAVRRIEPGQRLVVFVGEVVNAHLRGPVRAQRDRTAQVDEGIRIQRDAADIQPLTDMDQLGAEPVPAVEAPAAGPGVASLGAAQQVAVRGPVLGVLPGDAGIAVPAIGGVAMGEFDSLDPGFVDIDRLEIDAGEVDQVIDAILVDAERQ